MAEQLFRVPALDLALDHGRRRVTRGAGLFVDLGGQCRLWKILAELSKRFDAFYPKNDLIAAVWDEDGLAYYGIEDNTVYAAVSDLRRMLHPLGLHIKHVKGLGYRLEDLRGR
jgi:DNA-binding response OmpR family regulator